MFVRNITLALAMFLTACTATVQADVIIFRMVESNQTIGYDVVRPGTAAGYIVFDADTLDMRVLRANIVNRSRQFTISSPQGARFYVAKGPKGSTYTIVTRYQEKNEPYTEILDTMYGRDSILAIRPDRLVYFPKLMKSAPKQLIVPESEDDVILVTSTVSATYLGRETQSANAAGQSVDAAMERFRALYLAKGYYEVQDTQ